jgi:hypothetical protein
MNLPFLRPICLSLAVGVIFLGTAGMGMSFLVLGSPNPNEVVAGNAGFIAGSILIASGLLSLTLVATLPPVRASDEPLRREERSREEERAHFLERESGR